MLIQNLSYATVPTQFVEGNGIKFAYRSYGKTGDIPVIYFNHLTANLDNCDPRIMDAIAAHRQIISFDYRGVGATTGKQGTSLPDMAKDAIAFIHALGFKQVDIVAFSMGGLISRRYIAKYMNRYKPDVHQLIMLGTPNLGSLTAEANQLARFFGLKNAPSSVELTPASVTQFNKYNSQRLGIPFYSIAGNYFCLTRTPNLNPIEGVLGINDVAVSAVSALGIPLEEGWIYPEQIPACEGDHR